MIDLFGSIAMALSPSEDFDELYAVVNRDNGRMIERMALRIYDTVVNDESEVYVADQIYLDASVSYDYTVAQSTFSGLDHLEGEDVNILADGQVLDSETVTSGMVTLDHSYSTVCIGLGYYSDFVSLPIEVDGEQL